MSSSGSETSNAGSEVKDAASSLFRDISHESLKPEDEVKPAIIFESARGCGESVKLLLTSLPNATEQTFKGETALHVASRNGHLQIVELLLSAGADVNYRNYSGETALHHAASWNWPEILELLLKSGVHIDAATSRTKNTALHVAVKKRNLYCVTILLAHGCDVNLRTEKDNTALHHALKCTEALMSKTENRKSYTLSIKDKITEMLVTAPNVDLSLETQDGQNYLDFAASCGYDYGVGLLISRAKELLNHADAYGLTALHNAAAFGHYAVCKTLLARAPFLMNQQCTTGGTPLFLGVHEGQCSVIELFVSMGANCNTGDQDNCTPLHVAFSTFADGGRTKQRDTSSVENSTAIAEILKQLEDIGETCLFLAIGCYLIRDGQADVYIKNKFGYSALDILDAVTTENRDKVTNFVLKMVKAQYEKEKERTVTLQADHEFLLERIKYLELKASEDQDERRCQICMENFRNIVFLCGHGACQTCADLLETCHVCREIITKKIKCH